ncbi:hypothetical protein Vadar_000954 [Vaccinium darrowii]|uniref:Uncharacterized protein n=1 Tax=Vaccinium darrowii TaxID=229202 RepID=A0ACB7X6V1_9ERIC|nr:hypothetical protein Vadar_000954 [Vaccinium darrowii]
MVTEKSIPKLGSSDKPYQKLMLLDTQGTVVQATIFGSDIAILAYTLHIYRMYCMSNATVQPVPLQHKIIENEYQWILYARTPIEETPVDGLNIRSLTYNFTPFENLVDQTQAREIVDAIFAILHVGYLKPTTLTLWHQFGSKEGAAMSKLVGIYPTVVGLRMKISHFNANNASIKKVANNKAKKLEGRSSPSEDEIIRISRLPTTMETYALKVACCVINFDQRLWYLCCSDCGRITDALAGRDFWCNYCKKKLPPKPRCKFDVELEDITGVITTTAFGEIAESLFGLTAKDLYKNTDEDGLTSECIEKLMTPTHYLFISKPPTHAEPVERPMKKLKKSLICADKGCDETSQNEEVMNTSIEESTPNMLRSTKKKIE